MAVRARDDRPGDTSPHLPWQVSHGWCGKRAPWRARSRGLIDRLQLAVSEAGRHAMDTWRGRESGEDRDGHDRLSRRRARARRALLLRTVVVLAACWATARAATAQSRRRGRRLDRADGGWKLLGRDGEGIASTSEARRVVCASDGEGEFKATNQRFQPRRPSASGVWDKVASALWRAKKSKTVLFTGMNADSEYGKTLLEGFLRHYIDFGQIPAENVFVVLHSRQTTQSMLRELEELMSSWGVTYARYDGAMLLHSELYRYMQRQLVGVVDDEDWMILADVDEHLFVPPRVELKGEKYSIPLFLSDADALGYEIVKGVWIDRVSEDGSLKSDKDGSLNSKYPRKCRVGASCDVRRWQLTTDDGAQSLPRDAMVVAHKLRFDVSDARVLHDFGYEDIVPASALNVPKDNVFPVSMSVQHYQWHTGSVEQLQEASVALGKCSMTSAAEACKTLATKLITNGITLTEKTCPELSCSETASHAERTTPRVAIVTTVWEHVDGVSRTMKRFADYLRHRGNVGVLVMSPDLADRDYAAANSYNSVFQLVAPVPSIEVPGRPEYKMAPPLQARQRAVLETFDPGVVHVAAPDMLGHSAVRWAAEVGACSVCSYHTAFDTYMQYYHVSLLSYPIRHMLKDFYSMCDIVAVPTYAAAKHLRKMGVPGEKMGFFPRGVNKTLYNPGMRDMEYRKRVFGASADELVILWVARIVREKGLVSFVKTIKALNAAAKRDAGLPKFKVVVAGAGPDLPWVQKSLSKYDNVVILGHKGGENLAKTYAAGDIFFFPSKTEVIPNNLIEAMASGLPVVTDDVGVNRAIVQDEVSGIIVKNTRPIPGNVKNYVDALTRLMKDRKLAQRMSEAAVESTNGLTWKRTFESLLHAYKRCRPLQPYARHIPRKYLDNPKLYKRGVEVTESRRDVIVDPDAPANSLLYRISRGINGGYVRSLEDAAKDDETMAANGEFS